MIVLDTDHFVEIQKGTSPAATRLKLRLDEADDAISATIVSIEEIMRGWLSAIHSQPDPRKQISKYSKLEDLLRTSSAWLVLSWNEPAVARFIQLRAAKIRVATMDLKIASIALANAALLLSANLKHFDRIPGLQVEDWLHPT